MSSNQMLITTGIIILFVFCGACTTSQENTIPNDTVLETPTVATPIVTVVPVTEITEIPKTIAITMEPTPTPEPTVEAIEPDWTEVPIIYGPAEKDTTKINFTKYTNGDFMAEYPASWTLESGSVEVKDMTVNGKDMYKRDARKVSFISEDTKTRMVVITQDLVAPGLHAVTPTIENARRSVTSVYSDVSGESTVLNYKYAKNNQNLMITSFDVVLPNSSAYAPLSYTEQSYYTYNHYFIVRFIVTGSQLEEYTDVKYRMMNGIVTEGMQTGAWWR